MKTKKFHLGDVLSITTGRLVSSRHIDGVYEILNFMTDDNLFTHQLPRAMGECRPHLLRQFSQLATPEMDFAVDELDKSIEELKTKKAKAERVVQDYLAKMPGLTSEEVRKCAETDKTADAMDAAIKQAVSDWLATQVAKYGEEFEVRPIPKGAHQFKNPIAEAVEMMGGPEKVIVV